MPAVPIKVRCDRCGQLMGVGRSKAGGVVTCPRCSAEVAVPQPDETDRAVVAGPGSRSGSGILDVPDLPGDDDPESSLPAEFLDLRPEDLRVRPGDWSYPPPEPALAPAAVVESRREPDRDGPVRIMSAPAPSPPPAPAPQAPSPAQIQEVLLPPIRIEETFATPRHSQRRTVAPGSRDLVIPRSVVTAWSLLVLLAVASAFLAGLLAGHFVWKVH